MVSTSVLLPKPQELSQRHNAKPKLKLLAIVMKPCMEIEIEATEAVKPKQEEATHARIGQVRVLIDILER